MKEAQIKVKALKREVTYKIQRAAIKKAMQQDATLIDKYEKEMVSQRERLLSPYLSIKILDPAMGSGHFLAWAVDHLAEAIATDPSIEPLSNENVDSELTYYKRKIVESCIYGVDLNPLAVELAKLTLWLRTMARDKPLSFLNHHLKVGDSLAGARTSSLAEIPKVGKKLDLSREPLQSDFFTLAFGNKVGGLLNSHLLIEQSPTDTPEDIAIKKELEKSFKEGNLPFKIAADVWLSKFFGNDIKWDEYNLIVENLPSNEKIPNRAMKWNNLLQKEFVKRASAISAERHFFHWELEFPEIFFEANGTRKSNPGFDAVVGNPPYDVFEESLFDRLSVAAGCRNLAGHFVVRGTDLVKNQGIFGMVLPLSVSCGSDFEHVRKHVYELFGRLLATHYSIRPARLFPDVDQRITIMIALDKGKHPCNVESSRLYRFNEGQQSDVVLKSSVGNGGVLAKGYIPRVGDEIGSSIYKKLSHVSDKIENYLAEPYPAKNNFLYYHSVGRYWLKAYSSIPYFSRDKKVGTSSDITLLDMKSQEAAISVIGLINSSLFYYWWMLQCDEFHLLKTQILTFPFKQSLLADKNIQTAVNNLMQSYQDRAIRKTIHAGGNTIEMDEIHARLSRDFIRAIDKIIAVHYQLTEEEISYLDTYDEKFRTSASVSTDDEIEE